MNNEVFYAEEGKLAEFGEPAAGWYFMGNTDDPGPVGPFANRETAEQYLQVFFPPSQRS